MPPQLFVCFFTLHNRWFSVQKQKKESPLLSFFFFFGMKCFYRIVSYRIYETLVLVLVRDMLKAFFLAVVFSSKRML